MDKVTLPYSYTDKTRLENPCFNPNEVRDPVLVNYTYSLLGHMRVMTSYRGSAYEEKALRLTSYYNQKQIQQDGLAGNIT